MTQDTVRGVLYCKYCKGNPKIEMPNNIDLTSSSNEEFVENILDVQFAKT